MINTCELLQTVKWGPLNVIVFFFSLIIPVCLLPYSLKAVSVCQASAFYQMSEKKIHTVG